MHAPPPRATATETALPLDPNAPQPDRFADYDLRFFAWFPGPRLACIVPAGTALAVLDLRDGQVRTYPCGARRVGERRFGAFGHFAGWPEGEDKTTRLFA